jgi:5-methyltetrahydropteroyltriglutamate--homocysteine methyltransferase
MLAAQASGKRVDEAKLRDAVHRGVADQVRRQVETGISIVNDGEQSKPTYTAYVRDRLTGFEGGETEPWPEAGVAREFPGWAATHDSGRRPVGTGPLAWKDFGAVERDIANLKAATSLWPAEEIFMTSASPGTLVNHLGNRFYRSRSEYLFAIADVMKREYEAIVDSGVVLQLDCPDLASSRDRFYAALSTEMFRAIATENVEALNWSTREIPPDRMRMHVCWGAIASPHTGDIGLIDIVDILLKARPAALSIVAANARHAHEWRVWQEVELPDDKILIPGVIDSTTTIVEHPETVAERIERFVSVLGRERVIAGVDCGFATTGIAEPVIDPQVVWAKLEALARGAKLAGTHSRTRMFGHQTSSPH